MTLYQVVVADLIQKVCDGDNPDFRDISVAYVEAKYEEAFE